MDLVIRETEDVNAASQIIKNLPKFFGDTDVESALEDLKQNDLYGAFKKDKMIGFINIKEVNSDVIEIAWMAVSSDFQGKDIGSELLNTVLKRYKKDYKLCEVKTLAEVHPDEGYKKTRNFYKKHGFIPLETIHPYPGWSEDDPCQIFVKCFK